MFHAPDRTLRRAMLRSLILPVALTTMAALTMLAGTFLGSVMAP